MAKEDAKTIQLVDRILERAIGDGSSDIHVEPRKGEVRIRFRIDGVLVLSTHIVQPVAKQCAAACKAEAFRRRRRGHQ